MKHIGYFVSVNKGSNKVVAHSDADMSAVREGSFIRIGSDSVFYTVVKPEFTHIITDFDVVARNQIKINSVLDNSLLVGDNIYITYKEYELATIFNISNPGSG